MALVNQWTDAYALAAGFTQPDPTNSTRQVSVANLAGNWMIATVSWHTGAGAAGTPTVHVGDDVHNWWVPLYRISGPAGGVAIWAAPNARAASRVYVSPTDYVTGLSTSVMEHSGLGNYVQVLDRKNSLASPGTSASLTLAAPSGSSLAVVAAGSDSATSTLASATAGWTSATAVSGTNGVDLTSDTRLLPRYQTTSSSVSVTYTAAPAANLVAIGVTLLINAPAPAQPNANWPSVAFEVGFGSGTTTPRDSVTWVAPTKRLLSFTTARGRQFELGQMEAGETTLRLRNNDAAFNPLNAASPYYPYVIDGTPIRITATWAGRTYPVAHAYMDRWPQTWTSPHWGEVNGTAMDVWAAMTAELPSVAAGEIQLDAPWGYWPLSDPDEATVGSNLAANNAEPMRQFVSKYGLGSSAAKFGVDQGLLVGSSNATAWENRGLSSLQTTNGTSLQVGPGPVFPPVSGGWTVEFWARLDVSASQPASNLGLVGMKNGSGVVISVYVDQASQCAAVADYDPATHIRTNTVSATPVLTGVFTHFCLTFNPSGWQLYVNAQLASSRVVALDSLVTWIALCGQADELYHGRMPNGSFAHLAVFPRKIPYGRIVAHYWSASSGNLNDSSDQRISKLLAYADASWVPRSISYADTDVVPASAIEGQAVGSAVEEVAASDGAGLYVDDMGYLCATSKAYRYNRSPIYTFGDRPDLGEIPYLGDAMVVDFDPGQVANAITVTQAHYGRIASATDAASIQQRRRRPKDAVTHAADPLIVIDTANYLLLRLKAPGQRIAQIVIDPASNPTLVWPVALAIETGDVVTVNRRPLGGVLITGTFEVINIEHAAAFEKDNTFWKTSISLAPTDPFFFRLDDATYGVLDGPGVLGW